MTWDITTPTGSEAANQGDDRIRELKADLQVAFRCQTADGDEAKFPGADLANPIYRYRGLKGSTGARPVSGQCGTFFDTTRNVLQRDNGSTWDDIGTVIPAGTVMIFYQAAAPVGWAQVVTQNDKALRVVSGGSGGTAGGTLALSSTITLAHTHTVNAHHHSIAHKHTVPVGHSGSTVFVADSGSWGQGTEAVNVLGYQFAGAGFGPSSLSYIKSKDSDSANSGDTSPGTDSKLSDVALAYIDVILASKS